MNLTFKDFTISGEKIYIATTKRWCSQLTRNGAKALKSKYAGTMDFAKASKLVKELLS